MNDILNVLLDAEYLRTQFDTHPRDMWAYTILVFMVGIGIGFALSRRIKNTERRQTERTQRKRNKDELQALDREHVRQQVVFQDSSFVSMFGDGGLLQSIQSLPIDWLRTLLLVYNEGLMTPESKGQDAIMVELEHQGLLQVVGSKSPWRRHRLTYAMPQHVRMVITRNRETLEEMTQNPS